MFEYTNLDREKAITGYFHSLEPLKLRLFPSKQKKQYVVLNIILETMDVTRLYTEKELNLILKDIYPDFVTLRRGLVDYKLFLREKDGSKYWVNKKSNH